MTTAPATQARVAFWDPTLRGTLDRDGYAVTEFFRPSEVATLLDVWERLAFDGKDAPFSGTVGSADVAYRRAVHEAIATIAAPHVAHDFDGARFAYGNFVAKLGGPASALAFHRDPWFTDERAWEWLTLWVPLCDVDSANGCLTVVPGSHRSDSGAPRSANAPPVFRVSEAERAALVRDVPMRAGQACFMSASLIHGSPPNTSGVARVAASGLITSTRAPLAYVHREAPESSAPRTLLYRVEDDFYLTHVFDGHAPDGGPAEELPPAVEAAPA